MKCLAQIHTVWVLLPCLFSPKESHGRSQDKVLTYGCSHPLDLCSGWSLVELHVCRALWGDNKLNVAYQFHTEKLREKKTYSKLELHRYKSKTPTYVATNEKILHIVIQVRRESDGVESRKIRENCVGLPWDMKYCTTDKRFINVEHRVHKSSTGLFHSRVSDMK